MSKQASDLDGKDFEVEVLKSDKPVLVDFWADWCMPCRMMAPILDEIADELQEELKITKLDTQVSANQQIAFQYQVRSIPNMKLFKDGKVIGDFIGYRPKHVFIEELQEAINNT
ncbi:MAG: thioredoxin [Candidatus Dojkabacteria bacterium]